MVRPGLPLSHWKYRRIADDLKVGFTWFQPHQNSTSVKIFECPSIPEGTNHGVNNVKLLNVETEQIIRSGDEIWLETDNPLLMPLPDWRILDMQWVLQRLAAISGAAEAKGDLIGSDEESDDSVTFLEENDGFDDDDYPDYPDSLPTSPPSCHKSLPAFDLQLQPQLQPITKECITHGLSNADPAMVTSASAPSIP